MVRKKLMVFLLTCTMVLCFAGFALAAIPNLANTTWKGSAKQVTLTECSTVDIIFHISEQCGALFRGYINYGTQAAVDVVGKVGESGTTMVIIAQGIQTSQTSYRSVALNGSYNAGPPPFILVAGFGFIDTTLAYTQNLEFDTFLLNKQ